MKAVKKSCLVPLRLKTHWRRKGYTYHVFGEERVQIVELEGFKARLGCCCWREEEHHAGVCNCIGASVLDAEDEAALRGALRTTVYETIRQ